MRRVACLLANGFEANELIQPLQRLSDDGFDVDIIGRRAEQVVASKDGTKRVLINRAIADASVNDYLALLIPGGQSPEHLAEDPKFRQFIRDFDSSQKPIAAICHGPALLLRAGLVRGRSLAAATKVHAELRAEGADVVDEAVVSDANWITSRAPADLPSFCEAVALQFGTNADQSWMARGDIHVE